MHVDHEMIGAKRDHSDCFTKQDRTLFIHSTTHFWLQKHPVENKTSHNFKISLFGDNPQNATCHSPDNPYIVVS
jgi:hypothetical protein